MDGEKRKHSRTGSHYLVSYVCLDDRNQVASQGMGRTLNVSEGGILLETREVLDPLYTVSLTIAFEDVLMDLKGKVVSAKRRTTDQCDIGIQFVGPEEKEIRLLRQFIVMFGGDFNDTE